MKLQCFFVAPLLALTALAQAQTAKPITVGDPAPPFVVESWVKGAPIGGLEKGKVYIIEFWATWCGPCIASMPHLSDMADAMRGKAEMISVNVWDRRQGTEKEPGDKGHVDRVTKFVQDNDAKMRYNIVLDDSTETMSNTWLRAAGRNGIPCAFVVDRSGTIAWIGHPMDGMDKVVNDVVDGKWDTQAYKQKFEAQAAAAKKQAEFSSKLRASATKNSYDQFVADFQAAAKEDKEAASALAPTLVGALAAKNADDGIKFLKYVAGKELKGKSETLAQSCMVAAMNLKGKAAPLAEVAKISSNGAKRPDKKVAAVVYAYHARTLMYAGDKAGALEASEKGLALVDAFEPTESRNSIRNYIEAGKKEIAKLP